MLRKRFSFIVAVIAIIMSVTSCSQRKKTVDVAPPVFQQDRQNIREVLILEFVKTNFSQLRSDMAVGQGGLLTRLATVLDVKDADRERFYSLCKNNFNQLFITPETTAEELVVNLRAEMAKEQW